MTAPPDSHALSNRRTAEIQAASRLRRERAWELARQAAAVLRQEYRAARVVAFGSLPDPERFHPWSDVDLAAWGLPADRFFEAVARLLDLGGDIRVDLVMAERAKPALQEAIQAGMDL